MGQRLRSTLRTVVTRAPPSRAWIVTRRAPLARSSARTRDFVCSTLPARPRRAGTSASRCAARAHADGQPCRLVDRDADAAGRTHLQATQHRACCGVARAKISLWRSIVLTRVHRISPLANGSVSTNGSWGKPRSGLGRFVIVLVPSKQAARDLQPGLRRAHGEQRSARVEPDRDVLHRAGRERRRRERPERAAGAAGAGLQRPIPWSHATTRSPASENAALGRQAIPLPSSRRCGRAPAAVAAADRGHRSR